MKHYYCPKCTITLADRGDVCPNTHHLASKIQELSIADELQALFSQKWFYNDLGHQFTRKNVVKMV